ncbi:MAG: hypothetical protein CVU64_20705 [Deltaproteobacteria bacterium HGW-Deltaproteobacteria-21]|jgi:FKBP-type peptidyl-prolyl cis-trans isomerase SlyD|nr:MAG: hypothetical protein CVU64_20705 [Deltaproteobacteria bacterium HGW-Deltaproteobacteria-21]
MDEIRREKMVTLKYRMTTHSPEGAFEERTEERMSFVYGVEKQVPTLEKAIAGRSAGEKANLSIPPAEVYGEHDPALILEIPKKGLIKQRLKQGQFYRQIKMGTLVSFKVLEIRPDTVLVDFNKPMAGIRVNMDVEILEVREATGEEIRAAAEAQAKRTIGCG